MPREKKTYRKLLEGVWLVENGRAASEKEREEM